MRRSEQPTICVGGLVNPELPFARETMQALRDPASPFQAVLQHVPFFVDGLNFGDIVAIGAPDEDGIHPIEAVVEESGHSRLLLFLGDQPDDDGLLVHLGERFADHELRMEIGVDGLIAMSMHPDILFEEVADAIDGWFEEHLPEAPPFENEPLRVPTAYDIIGPIETVTGPLAPAFPPRPDDPPLFASRD